MTRFIASLMVFFGDLKKSERGATAVEYGIMIALIAIVIIGAVTALGNQLSTLFANVPNPLGGGAGGE